MSQIKTVGDLVAAGDAVTNSDANLFSNEIEEHDGVLYYKGTDVPLDVGRIIATRAWVMAPIAHRLKKAT